MPVLTSAQPVPLPILQGGVWGGSCSEGEPRGGILSRTTPPCASGWASTRCPRPPADHPVSGTRLAGRPGPLAACWAAAGRPGLSSTAAEMASTGPSSLSPRPGLVLSGLCFLGDRPPTQEGAGVGRGSQSRALPPALPPPLCWECPRWDLGPGQAGVGFAG